MCPDPRQELAEILSQTSAYLNGLKADGITQIEVSLASVSLGRLGETPRPTKTPAPPPAGILVKPVIPAPARMENEMARIALEIAGCKKCALHQTRIQTVPGQGNAKRPELMFIGEAPGADEDEQGLAFVGRAGQLVTKMITAMGFRREEVFIANILKCRPPDNRPPTPEEMAICLPFLKRQIAEVQPKVIVALGATAVLGLLNLTGISQLRGKWLSFEGIDLMPTYHPSYLLRNPVMKKEAWSDLQEVLKRLGRSVPPAKK
ncbi:MAG: uracil-DNA glycosylase [bacterium]